MTAEDMQVERSSLGRLELLAKGGQATIFRLPDFQLRDVPGPLVAKLYKRRYLPVPAWGLARLADKRHRLEPARQADLDRYFTWPVRVIVEGGNGVGCVMRELPEHFFHAFRFTSGQVQRRPLEIQHLIAGYGANARVGLPPINVGKRLSFCFETARALKMLHSSHLELIYGDISARNVLFTVERKPTIVFVEGDGVRSNGAAAVVPQVETPDWNVPGRTSGRAWAQSQETDCYKLGLMILRVLTPGPGASVNRDPRTIGNALDREGREMLWRALGDDRQARPTAVEWHDYFRARLVPGSAVRPRAAPEPAPPSQRQRWERDDSGAWRLVDDD